MNDKFDDLAKGLAQSVTRRGALKKFGFGLAAIVAAAFGLSNAQSAPDKPATCCTYECGSQVGVYTTKYCTIGPCPAYPPNNPNCGLVRSHAVKTCVSCN